LSGRRPDPAGAALLSPSFLLTTAWPAFTISTPDVHAPRHVRRVSINLVRRVHDSGGALRRVVGAVKIRHDHRGMRTRCGALAVHRHYSEEVTGRLQSDDVSVIAHATRARNAACDAARGAARDARVHHAHGDCHEMFNRP
jgi:hypothetical protein